MLNIYPISVIFCVFLIIQLNPVYSSKDPYDVPFKKPQLNNVLLDRFIVVPEKKILFCYIEKVGCTTFNHLFAALRGQKWKWFLNSPSEHNMTKSDLEKVIADPSWHKAVFYRHPLDRLLSAYKSKCEFSPHRDSDGATHCQAALNLLKIGRSSLNRTQDFRTVVKYLADHNTAYHKQRMNVHWAPQSVFCGGLTKNLHYFQTVELFNPQDLRGKVETMLKSAGIKKPATDIKDFDITFSGNKQQQKRWTHAEQFALEYYTSGIVRDSIRYYLEDYLLFGVPLRGWALQFLPGLF